MSKKTFLKSVGGLDQVDNTRDVDKPLSSATLSALTTKNDVLVSGTNIHTINGQSLLSAGNLVVDKNFVGLDNVIETDAPNNGVYYCRHNGSWQKITVPVFKDNSMIVNSSKLNFLGSVSVNTVNGDETNIDILGNITAPYIYANSSSFGQVSGINFLTGFSVNYGPYGVDVYSTGLSDDAPSDNNYYSRYNGSWAMIPYPLSEAPYDGNYYARMNGNWQSFSIGGGGIGEAPSDGNYYARYNGYWQSFSISGGGIGEAPYDGNQYSRQNGSWTVTSGGGGIGDAPNDGNYYARMNGNWQSFSISGGGGIGDAPYDGNYYARQNGNWYTFSTGIGEAPYDGNQYARQNGSWYIVSGGGGGIGEAPYDGNYYARQNGSWYTISTGLAEAPYDGNTYARQNGNWTSTIPEAPNDGNIYGRQNNSWVIIQ